MMQPLYRRGKRLAALLLPLLLLLALLLAGNALAPLLPLRLPGAIIGMVLYLLALVHIPALRATLPAAHALIGLLGMLIVPAAVGLVPAFPAISNSSAGRLALLLVITTLITGIATALLAKALLKPAGP
jgi:holin-like protein